VVEVISKIATKDQVNGTEMNKALIVAEFVIESDEDATVVL
jgi:hypothetical protein